MLGEISFEINGRTLIAAIAIGIGLAALIFVDALMIGMTENMVRTATASFLGEAQIHRVGFRDAQEVSLTIQALDEVTTGLAQEEIVEHFTQRVLASGMITSPANVSAVVLVGVHPPTERFLSQMDNAITEGVYFEGVSSRDIVIGAKLAETLEIGLGDRVVVTVAASRKRRSLARDVQDFRYVSICWWRDEQRYGVCSDPKSARDAGYRGQCA